MFCVRKSRTFGRICAGCLAGKSCTGFMQENHILHVGKLQGFSCHRASSGAESIIKRFPEVFTGLGKLKDFKLKLDVDKTVPPVIQPARKVPYHKRIKIGEAIDKLLADGVIEPATGPTEWCSPLHAIAKKDGSLRVCVDMRKVNEAILRTRYPIPTLDDAIEKIAEAGSKIFSKVDLNQGYHQIELDEESRDRTTFACSKGIYLDILG